jgi:hypothetical protein
VIGQFVPWTDRRNSPGWIEDDAGCHIWTGATGSNGYGIARVSGRTCLVHRLRYEREIGPIPLGMQLDHYVCDNGQGGCCNPHHCRPVTARENVLRGNGPSAKCAAKSHCPYGHPYIEENLVRWYKSKRGVRICRICHNERKRQRNNPNGNPASQDKTHCPAGHPYTPENIIPWEAARGRRKCRICRNARWRNRSKNS